MASAEAAKPSVMFSFTKPVVGANPYVELLVDAVLPHAAVSYFSWRHLVTDRPDILHVQWPEAMTHSSSRIKMNAKGLIGSVLLLVAFLRGTRLVRTVHNLRPHESQPLMARWFEWWLQCLTSHRIYINVSAENPRGPNSTVILHGTFRDRYGPLTDDERENTGASLLLFGLLRRYKGVEALIDAHAEIGSQPAPRLRICGVPSDSAYESELRDLAASNPSVSIQFGHLSDADLRAEIRKCSLVVLPYRNLYNSGALLAALSIGRPVLVPRLPSTEPIQAEFGFEWVALFDDELGPDDLMDALDTTRQSSSADLPDMSARNWMDAGRAHLKVYLETARRFRT